MYAGALAAVRERRLDEAIQRLEQVLTLPGGVSDSLVANCRRELGLCYAEKGMLDRAIAELKAALAADPGDVRAGCHLASIYDRCGRRQEAIAECQALLQRAPACAEARSALWTYYIEQGDYQRAAETARRALRSDPECAAAHIDLAVALKHQGLLDEANAVLDQIAGKLPPQAGRLCELAEMRLLAGRLGDAMAALRRALEVDPHHEVAIEMLAETCLLADDCQQAIEVCQGSRRRGAERVPILDILVAACERLGDTDLWLGYARELVQLCPMDAYAHYRLGAALQHRGDYPAAMERYALAADLAAGDEQVAQSAAEAIETLDTIQQQQILALAASNSVFRLRLARDPERALREHGFQLTEEGLHLLMSVDMDELSRVPGSGHPGGSH